jgi:hypothetical protein
MSPRIAALAGLLLIGCGPDIEGAIRLDAFASNGTDRSIVDPAELIDAQRRGLVIAYQQGDAVQLTASLKSNLMEQADDLVIDLAVLRPIWLYTGPGGVYLSTDGFTFRPWAELMHGSLTFSVGLNSASKTNVAAVQLESMLSD